MGTFLKILSGILSAIGPFFEWLKQKEDPDVKRKNRLIEIEKEVDKVLVEKYELIERLKNEKNESKREIISDSIISLSDRLKWLRNEKKKLSA